MYDIHQPRDRSTGFRDPLRASRHFFPDEINHLFFFAIFVPAGLGCTGEPERVTARDHVESVEGNQGRSTTDWGFRYIECTFQEGTVIYSRKCVFLLQAHHAAAVLLLPRLYLGVGRGLARLTVDLYVTDWGFRLICVVRFSVGGSDKRFVISC